jgi:hypothetical protein
MKIEVGLNHDCMKLLPRVKKVFKIDDDELRLILSEILLIMPDRVVGMKSFGKGMCSQVAFYELPDGYVVSVAYPYSTYSIKIDYDKFDDDLVDLFDHVENKHFSGSMYGFLLTLLDHGCVRKSG